MQETQYNDAIPNGNTKESKQKKMNIKIKKGTIKCKFCNKDYPDVLAAYSCSCGKRTKWDPPLRDRKMDKGSGGLPTHKKLNKTKNETK